MRNKKIGQFAKGSAILILSNIVLKAINFFLLPLYTKYLPPEELGISDNISNIAAFVYPILVMAFDSAFGAFYYADGKEETKKKVFMTTRLFLYGTSMVAVALVFASPVISGALFGSGEYAYAIGISLSSVAINLWYLSDMLMVRLENRMLLFSIINVVASFSMIVLNVIFVSIMEWGYMALIWSSFIVQCIQLVCYRAVNSVKTKASLFDKKLWRNMACFAFPLLPTVVANWVLGVSDRYILLYYGMARDIGLYGVAARFQGVLSVVTGAIYTAYTSFAFSSQNDENAKEGYVKVLDAVYLLLSIICFSVSIFSREIVEVMADKEYEMVYQLIGPLLFGQICYAANTMIGYGFAYANKTLYYLYPVLIGSIANFLANLLFIPLYGAEAAAFTTFGGYFIMLLVTYLLSQKVYFCPYHMKRLLGSLSLNFIIYMIGRDLKFVYKFGIGLVFIFAVFYLYRDILVDLKQCLKRKK